MFATHLANSGRAHGRLQMPYYEVGLPERPMLAPSPIGNLDGPNNLKIAPRNTTVSV